MGHTKGQRSDRVTSEARPGVASADHQGIPAPGESGVNNMQLEIELDREVDGRWIAGVPDLPGVIVYGDTRQEAIVKAKVLALQVIADQREHGELPPDLAGVTFAAPVEVTLGGVGLGLGR